MTVSRLSHINTHTHTCPELVFDSECEPVRAGGQSQVFVLFGFSLDRWICILLENVSHQLPGPAESKTSIHVKVSGVETDINSLLYHMVHITCGLV